MLTFPLLVTGDDTLGDDVDSECEGGGDEEPTGLCNHLHPFGRRKMLVQGCTHHLRNL